MGFISDSARSILAGMSIWPSHSRFVIPSAVVRFFGVLMLLSSILHTIFNYDDISDWLSKAIDFGWVGIYLSSIYITTFHKEEIQSLGEELDRWWNYSCLEEETAELKKESEDWMRTFRTYYVGCSLISLASYVLSPAAMQRGALIFATWTPFPIQTTWGYAITYALEAIMIAFAYGAYIQVFLLVMTFAIVMGKQMRLVGAAFLTIFKRVDKMMKNNNFETRKEFYEAQSIMLEKELRNGVIHFQHLYRCAFRLSEVFSFITNITYYGGMWGMCLIAVKAATEMTFVALEQAIMLVCAIILNQYAYSFINESLIEEVQKLRNVVYDSPWYEMPIKLRKSFHIFHTMLDSDRFPTLRTIMGSQANMENLTTVINASYCYFSMLITIKSSNEATSTLGF